MLVEGLQQDSAQFWLTSMLVKTIGLLSAGVAVGRVFTASAGIVTVVFATILAWLALGAVQIIGRSLAVGNAEQVALRLAPLACTLVVFLSPFTFMLYRAGERLSAKTEERDDSAFLSEDGLRRLMQVDEEGSTIAESEKEMIAGILDMNTTVAREVMVPRIDMLALPVDCTMHQALDESWRTGTAGSPCMRIMWMSSSACSTPRIYCAASAKIARTCRFAICCGRHSLYLPPRR